MDLLDLSFLFRVNVDYTFFLTFIDVLSKYAYVVHINDKYAKSLVYSVTYVFTTSKKMPNNI